MLDFERDELEPVRGEHSQEGDFDEADIDSLQRITNTMRQEQFSCNMTEGTKEKNYKELDRCIIWCVNNGS